MRKTLMIAAVAGAAFAFGTVSAAEPAPASAAAPAAPAKEAPKKEAKPPVLMPAPAGIQAKEVTEPPTTIYKVLADAKGMTLYTYDNDKPSKSNCNNECAKFWPPLTPDAGAKPVGTWTIMTRDDGSKQWAVGGRPVYTFIKDTRTWDFDGQNQPKDKPVWHFLMLEKKTAPETAPAVKK